VCLAMLWPLDATAAPLAPGQQPQVRVAGAVVLLLGLGASHRLTLLPWSLLPMRSMRSGAPRRACSPPWMVMKPQKLGKCPLRCFLLRQPAELERYVAGSPGSARHGRGE